MDMPLAIHKDAFRAALATHCAEEQGKFWEMHDRLFANQRALEPLKGHAEALGLDVVAFESCMASEKYAEAVRKDMAEAQKAGVSGTPSSSVAPTPPIQARSRGSASFAAPNSSRPSRRRSKKL